MGGKGKARKRLPKKRLSPFYEERVLLPQRESLQEMRKGWGGGTKQAQRSQLGGGLISLGKVSFPLGLQEESWVL